MMSQKSLKNNVKLTDFTRSLAGSVLFPAIALIVLFIVMTAPVIAYVTSDEFAMSPVHNEVSMFLAPTPISEYMFGLIPTGMVMCGILTAVKSFCFTLSKKQVNVFFSLGTTRQSMYVNRTLAGIIALFLAVLIPMTVIYIINIVCFGYSAHLTELFLYIVSLLFVSGISGFAVGAAAIMISGNLFETALTCITATTLPQIIANIGESFCVNYLKGYANVNADTTWMKVLTPWSIGVNLGKDYVRADTIGGIYNKIYPEDILGLLTRETTPDKFEVPELYQVDLGFTLPIIIWLAVSVILISIGAILFKARKAEHANSFGHFTISRAINSTFVFVFVLYMLGNLLYNKFNPVVFLIIVAVVALIAYFLVQLLMTRKLKTTLKSLSWYSVLVSATALMLVIVCTGFFGTYNKTPEKEELKSVSAQIIELSPYRHFINTWDDSEDFVESSTEESIETITAAFDAVKNEKVIYGKEPLTNVTFVFRDKDDELKYRTFEIFSEEVYYEYIKAIYDSDFFDSVLYEYLIKDPPVAEEETPEYGVEYAGQYVEYAGQYDVDSSEGYLKEKSWVWADSNMLLEVGEGLYPVAESIADTGALCKALYNDLTKMTFEQLFRNINKPIGVLVSDGCEIFRTEEYVYPIKEYGDMEGDYEYTEQTFPMTGMTGTHIPVYPEMTETVKYLKDNGYEVNEVKATVKQVFYTDSPISFEKAKGAYAKVNAEDYSGWGDYTVYFPESSYSFNVFETSDFNAYSLDFLGYFLDEKVNGIDMLKEVYKTAEHPLTSVTDTAKAEDIIEKSVSKYLTYGDNGRYVYVIYEEGTVVCYYLPEANVSVLK